MCCILPPGYLTSGRQNRYLRQLRRTAPFAYVKTLTRTADGSDSAQWEVQLVVTDTGYELLSW